MTIEELELLLQEVKLWPYWNYHWRTTAEDYAKVLATLIEEIIEIKKREMESV